MYLYSPLPLSNYRLPNLPSCEASVIAREARSLQVWNLFWLSNPTIDLVPKYGADWWKHYHPVIGGLSAIITDVREDECLFRKLSMHPDAFSVWFEREDHTIYDAYDVLGGEAWVANVMSRADLAAARMAVENPPVEVKGNVIRVNFRRSA